jgi:hypothetical protein
MPVAQLSCKLQVSQRTAANAAYAVASDSAVVKVSNLPSSHRSAQTHRNKVLAAVSWIA